MSFSSTEGRLSPREERGTAKYTWYGWKETICDSKTWQWFGYWYSPLKKHLVCFSFVYSNGPFSLPCRPTAPPDSPRRPPPPASAGTPGTSSASRPAEAAGTRRSSSPGLRTGQSGSGTCAPAAASTWCSTAGAAGPGRRWHRAALTRRGGCSSQDTR